MAFKLSDIAAVYNRSTPTTCNHIKQLKQEGKFTKRTPGKQYSENEVKQLAKLLDFPFSKIQNIPKI